MNKPWQIYYTAVLGALGGLLGWWVIGSFSLVHLSIWVAFPIVGAGLGLFIGGCVAATDGALIKRVPRRAIRDGFFGAVAGLVAGLVGLLLAEIIFLTMGAGFVGRILGWMLLGGFIGLSDMVVSRQRRRALFGAFGGLIGGALGGLLYEGLTQLFLAQSGLTQVVVGGVGLMLLGACIGALIPLARQVLSRGELRVLNGDQIGLVREVIDHTSIGRYDGCDIYLPDPAVSWRHANICRTSQGFTMEIAEQSEQGVMVGNQQVNPGDVYVLRSGERIYLGETALEFVGR